MRAPKNPYAADRDESVELPLSSDERNGLGRLQSELDALLGARAAAIRLDGQITVADFGDANGAKSGEGTSTKSDVVARVAGLLNAEHELGRILTVACAEAASALNVPAASILLYEEPSDASVWAGEATVLPSPAMRAQVAVDLRQGTELVGRLNLMDSEPRVFDELKMDLLRAIADPVGKAVARARAGDRLRANEKQEAMGGLAGGIAHQFNNLLTPVVGAAEVLLEGGEARGAWQADGDSIREAGQTAAELTGQLLGLSERQVLQPRALDVITFVDGLRALIASALSEDVDLVITQGTSIPPIDVDPARLERVIIDLVTNAREAMPTGGRLTITTANAVPRGEHPAADVRQPPRVLIAVSDTGLGMDEDTRARILEPFLTTKGSAEHSGLGMATAYGIVRQSGGDITVASRPGTGSTITLSFAAAEVAADVPAHAGEGAPGSVTSTETILVVHDEESIRRFVTRVLRRKGYDVREAASGPEALALLEREPHIELLLTDIVLPGLGGREVAEAARAAVPGLETLFMSGYVGDSLVHRGRLDPGIALLQKPFTPEALACRVRGILDQNRAAAGIEEASPVPTSSSAPAFGARLPRAETPPAEPQRADKQRDGTTRAPMREGLADLFRNTEQDAATRTPVPGPRTPMSARGSGTPPSEPSEFLRSFLEQAAPSPEPAPSGLANLDARLDGGFGPGLHLVRGKPGVGRTALLQTVAWEAVSHERPVLYYALKEGSLGAWKRFARTLGSILGEPALPFPTLPAPTPDRDQLEALTRVDLALQSFVLPYLTLVETIPAVADTVGALTEDVRLRAREARARHGRTPLVLIDDLERMLGFPGGRTQSRLLSRLDDALVADALPGLLGIRPAYRSVPGPERLPSQTTLALVSVSPSRDDALERVDLEVQANARTGWTGVLPLVLDRRSGLFVSAPPLAADTEAAEAGPTLEG